MSGSDELLAHAFKRFVHFEKTLRRAIETDLGRRYGPLWEKKIPSPTLESCKTKRDNNIRAGWAPEREITLLDYADFSELTGIIDYCWAAFERRFGNKQITLGKLEEIRLLRNALMHSNMQPQDCPRIIALCDELDRRCAVVLEEIQLPGEKPTKVEIFAKKRRPEEALAPDEMTLQFFEQMKPVLDKMSGKLEGELEALKNYLSRQIARCSSSLLEHVRDKFGELPCTDAVVDELLNELPPKRPSDPQEGWPTKKWISWAVNEYMPYKQWLINHGQSDLLLEKQTRGYEEWLYNSYPKMLSHTDKLVFGTYTYVKRELDRGHRVLWALIDNLSCFWSPILIKALLENDLVPSQPPVYQLAMLPSETSVSRTSALLGLLPSQIAAHDIMAAFRETWRARGVPNVRVISGLDELDEISQYDADLFLFVHNRLDHLAHTPDYQLDDREDEIRFVLSKLASRLSVAVKSLAELSSTKLVISSDHGSTRLYEEGKKLEVPPSATEDDTYREHSRFIRTSKLDSLDSCDWFALPADKFGLPDNYAVARDSFFISTRPLAYTHGGLTPEETLVPLLVFEPGTLPKVELHFEQVSGPIRPGRPQRLSLLVRNPFPLPIQGLEITLPDYGVQFEPLTIDGKTEVCTEERNIELPPRIPVEGGVAYVDLIAVFKVGGLSGHQSTKLKLKTRQLYVTEMDEFGDMF
jgi:hypothetical protein